MSLQFLSGGGGGGGGGTDFLQPRTQLGPRVSWLPSSSK